MVQKEWNDFEQKEIKNSHLCLQKCNKGAINKTTKREKKKEKTWMPAQKDIAGIPVCEKYKYLGTWLSPKLSCDPQIRKINKKAGALYTRLYPYLASASADGRRDMFMTMVAPLFNAAHILLSYENSVSHRRKLE